MASVGWCIEPSRTPELGEPERDGTGSLEASTWWVECYRQDAPHVKPRVIATLVQNRFLESIFGSWPRREPRENRRFQAPRVLCWTASDRRHDPGTTPDAPLLPGRTDLTASFSRRLGQQWVIACVRPSGIMSRRNSWPVACFVTFPEGCPVLRSRSPPGTGARAPCRS